MHDLNGAALVTKSGRILVVGATQLITDHSYGELGDFVIYGLNNTIANCSAITADAGHDTAVCSGQSANLGTPALPGYQYRWSDGHGLSSTTTAQTTALTYYNSIYWVTVKDASGCIAIDSVKVAVNLLPEQPSISPEGSFSICQGNGLMLSTTATGSLQWLNNGAIIAGATSASYRAAAAGQYAVKVTDTNTCSATSRFVNVSVYPGPPAPVITQNGSTLQSSASTGNQWYLNGTAIPGATAATYTATTSGVYTVKVTLNGCQSTMSNAVNFATTGINSPELDKRIVMAPNPVIDYLNINYTGSVGRFTITVYNIFGVQVYGSAGFNSTFRLDMRSYAAGVYAVQIVNTLNGEQIHRLIMKQ
jgi:hypothetical protein